MYVLGITSAVGGFLMCINEFRCHAAKTPVNCSHPSGRTLLRVHMSLTYMAEHIYSCMHRTFNHSLNLLWVWCHWPNYHLLRTLYGDVTERRGSWHIHEERIVVSNAIFAKTHTQEEMSQFCGLFALGHGELSVRQMHSTN